MRTTCLAGLIALAVPACLTGTGDITGGDPSIVPGGPGGGDDTGGGTSPMVVGTVDKATLATELGKTETLTYTITSVNGFVGTVTPTASVIGAAGAVSGWTLTPSATTVDLASDGSASLTLTVMIPTDDAELMPTVSLALASSAAPATVSSALTVANQFTITIDEGTGPAAPHTGLPSANVSYSVHAGAKVIFHNADTIDHEIHADGGIPHEGGELTPGSDYVTTPTDDATWYCHDHEGSSGINRKISLLTP